MITHHLSTISGRHHQRSNIIADLIESRNIYNTDTIHYERDEVRSMDLGESIIICGLLNGSFNILGTDTNGVLVDIAKYEKLGSMVQRVQLNPTDQDFFSILDTHSLSLFDPDHEQCIENFSFEMFTYWSEWCLNNDDIIAVCGSLAQVRLVDIRVGNSAQTIILSANSGLKSLYASRCLWSRQDSCCLIVGDSEGCLHVYDTRHSSRPIICVTKDWGQISGMSFTTNDNSIITSQGIKNNLTQWDFDEGTLVPQSKKFEKKKKKSEDKGDEDELCPHQDSVTDQENPGKKLESKSEKPRSRIKKPKLSTPSSSRSSTGSRTAWIPASQLHLRCQFYVSDRHIYCPTQIYTPSSKELFIYDLITGDKVKTIKSPDTYLGGINAVIGSLPDNLIIYAGGRQRLRVWTIDEDYHRRQEEKIAKFHTTNWDDSGDET